MQFSNHSLPSKTKEIIAFFRTELNLCAIAHARIVVANRYKLGKTSLNGGQV